MIILDTNVLSELMVEWQTERRVLAWLRSLDEQPVTTAFNRAELLAGVALLPDGRKRQGLADAVNRLLAELTVSLPFTEDCASAYAEIVAIRTRVGRPIGTMDALIASVALVNDAAVATRDVAGFAGLGLTVLHP